MDKFINQINATEPVTIVTLRSLQRDPQIEALGGVTAIQLSSYKDKTHDNLLLLKSLKQLEAFQLTHDELARLLLHLKEVTLYWKTSGFPNWGIESLIIRECQGSSEVFNVLYELFSSSALDQLSIFHWIAIEKDKSSELGEKVWRRLCKVIRVTPRPYIHSLRIPNSKIGDKGCKKLVKLCFNSKFQEIDDLDLAGNHIGNSGFCDLIRTIQIVDIASKIRYLDISRNRISAQGMKDAYSHLKLCYFQNLEVLRLGGNPLNKRWIQMMLDVLTFHTLPNLHCLDLSGIKMGTEGMTGLAVLLRSQTIPALQELGLRDCGLGDKELVHLSYTVQDGFAPNLQRLDLSSNSMKCRGIEVIHRMFSADYLPNLEFLDLSDNHIGNEGIRELGNGADLRCLAQVKVLHLCRNQITDEGASCIYLYVRNRFWRNIQQLFLDDNSFSKISVIHLQSLVNMNNFLNCIYLNDMTRRRDFFLHFDYSGKKASSGRSIGENKLDENEENEQYLREIFEESEDQTTPPYSLRRTSNDKDGSWTPVNATITPIPGSVGLGVDSDVYPSPIA